MKQSSAGTSWVAAAVHGVYKAGRRICRVPGLRTLVPTSVRGHVQWWLMSRVIDRLPDRLYMENTILPAIVALKPGRVLDVGLDTYTQHYYRWFPTGCEYWTIDILPKVAHLGREGRHITGDVLDIEDHFAPASLDVVMLNGAFGYGIDRLSEQQRVVESVRKLLKPGGRMVVGWDMGPDGTPVVMNGRQTDHIKDPRLLEPVKRHFTHTPPPGLPAHVEFEGCSHVYDWFKAC